MRRGLTVSGYRAIDLSLFALMLAVFEGVVTFASTRWFPAQPYAVSVVPAIVAIVTMRWGPWAALHAALGGALTCLFSRGTPGQYLIYGIGNLGGLIALALVKKMGEEAIRKDALKALLFGLITVLCMDAGRALIALALGSAPPACLGFFTTDAVTWLFTLVIVWIVRRLDGVFENQHHYLLRVQREQEEERGGLR